MTATNNIVPDGTEQSWDASLGLLSAVKRDKFPPVVAGFDGFVECDVIHETDHEDAAGFFILDDGGDEAVEFCVIEIHCEVFYDQARGVTGQGNKKARRYCGGHPFV